MGTGIEEVAIPAVIDATAKGAEAAGGADLLAPAFAGGAEGAFSGAEGAFAGLDAAAGAAVPTPEAYAAGIAAGDIAAPSSALTVYGTPAAAAGGGFGIGDILSGAASGLGGLASGIGNVLAPSAGAAELPPGGAAPSGAAPTDPLSAVTSGGFPSPQGTGQSASAFAPAPGVQLPAGIAPDATSAAAFDPLSFADRALPAEQAGNSGVFSSFEIPESPPGSGAGAATFSPAPPGSTATTFPPGGTPTATPGAGDFTSLTPSATPGAPGGGFDFSGNPIDPLTGSSNPQYPGGGITTAYDPTGATIDPATAAKEAGSTSAITKAGQGALDSLTKNPIGVGLAGAGLGLNLLNANKQSAATKQLAAQAGKQSSTADQLANYALTGTVPPGSQAGIDKAIAEAKANAVSNAAGQGLPTDPTKNTALAATLAKIDAQGPILAAQIAQQMLQSGASYAGLSNQLYTQLANIDQSQRAGMGKAIANFAAAFNQGGRTTINLPGSNSSAA